MRLSILSILFSAALSVSLGGCDALNDLDNISVEVKSTVTVPGATALDMLLGEFPQAGGLNSFDFSQSNAFKNSKYGPEDVDSIKLEALSFAVVSPAGQDLSFLGTVIVSIETDTLPKIEIARQETFPEGETKVSFTTSSADLKNYVLGTSGTVTTETTGSKRPDQETQIEIRAVFDADIKVL